MKMKLFIRTQITENETGVRGTRAEAGIVLATAARDEMKRGTSQTALARARPHARRRKRELVARLRRFWAQTFRRVPQNVPLLLLIMQNPVSRAPAQHAEVFVRARAASGEPVRLNRQTTAASRTNSARGAGSLQQLGAVYEYG